MPQYTSISTTPGGSTVSTVLNTVTNTIAITFTTPTGTIATTTIDANVTDLINPVVALRDQLSVKEPTLSSIDLSSGVRNGVISGVADVKGQAAAAGVVSTATNTTVPAAPTPPTPVAAADNPNPTPNPDVVVTPVRDAPPATTEDTPNTTATTPIIENTAPLATTNPDVNNGAIGLGVDTATATSTVVDDGTDPYVSNGQSTILPVAQQTTSGYIDYRALYPQAQSDPYDETGTNLNPGWTTDEFKQPYWVGFATSANPSSGNAIGVVKATTQSTATTQDSSSFQKAKDWRVRISLAPNSKYLYNATNPGILEPLSGLPGTGTNGVIFPYTPNISVAYAASYDPTDIAHSNYKIFQYKNSSVDSISITGDFTAQDTNEANYLLAVIHFFRSVTKMFYGQDNNPKPGVPPPLCYLSGFGTYQFDNHPMVITNFTYTTPTDVDYIRAGSQTNMPGQSVAQQPSTVNTSSSAPSAIRLFTSNLTPRIPNFQTQNSAINSNATYVPTKISIAITALPVVARNDISNRFSLEKYATGQLLQGSKNNGGGIW